ncbi:MAG: hypothetical protein HXY23_09560 [Parvularculaceae bacterium]|nr:hypothetical protein [Parvularculaceae bacterium]
MDQRRADAPRQMSLKLPEAPRLYPPGSYLVTGANRDAYLIIRAFTEGQEAFLVLSGPRGSGKTHLLHELFGASGIAVATDAELGARDDVVALDDCHKSEDPMRLLRFLESRAARGLRTVLAGDGRPRTWAGGLKDLETRLEAMPRAELGEPDEPLLEAVLGRHFAARRLKTSKDFAAFSAPRIPRRFAAAAAFADAAAAAAHEGASLNVSLAKMIIENLFEAPVQT